jgi:hypothetical protein
MLCCELQSIATFAMNCDNFRTRESEFRLIPLIKKKSELLLTTTSGGVNIAAQKGDLAQRARKRAVLRHLN